MEAPLNPLAELGARVARVQDRALDDMPLPKTKERLLQSPARVSRRSWALPAGVALLALLSVALWWRAPQRELAFTLSNGEPPVVGQWIGASAADPVVLQFTDGTSVSLAPGASARVASLDEHGARIVVERGMVDVAVVHRPGARWDLDVGPFAVRVTGTRFRVSWDPTTTRLLVELREGSVLVSGPIIGDGRRVAAGETLTVSIATSEMQLTTAEPAMASEVNDVAPTAAARAEPPVASAASDHAAA